MMRRLATLRAEHVMTPEVIVLRDSDSIPQAVSTLKSHHISGAPVVDETGKLVGLLSISDIVGGGEPPPEGVRQERLVHRVDSTVWTLFDRAQAREKDDTRTVRDCMTSGFTSVERSTALIDVARIMCTGHWHRVPVVDDDGALCGMITTLDILAALVNAADESKQKSKP